MTPKGWRARGPTASAQLIVHELEQVLQALRSGIPQEWFTLGLTMPQLRTLFVLLEEGQARMGILASHIGVSLSGATGIMDHLVEKGLAERAVDPDDRRSVVCRLSPRGRELAERLMRLRRSQWEERLSALTQGELACALLGIEALAKGIARSRDVASTSPMERVCQGQQQNPT